MWWNSGKTNPPFVNSHYGWFMEGKQRSPRRIIEPEGFAVKGEEGPLSRNYIARIKIFRVTVSVRVVIRSPRNATIGDLV